VRINFIELTKLLRDADAHAVVDASQVAIEPKP
jgi:hypothetical protein